MKTKKLYQNPALLLVVMCYVFILFILLNRQNAWMQPEMLCTKMDILSWGKGLGLTDLVKGLDPRTYENATRFTRPWSGYMQLVDTKLRFWLWKIFLPHPSFSLVWLFTLILTPLLFLGFLKNIGIKKNNAYLGLAFFMASPGYLSTFVMLFHPAKAMTNFSILAALYFGSKIAKYKNLKHSKNIHHYSYFILFIFFSFFWDETALILYPLILLFFPNLILKNQRRLLLYVCLPFATAFVYFLLYPLLLDLTMQASAPLSNFVSFKEFLSLRFVHRMTNNFTLNTSLLLSDSFGLQSLKLIPHTPYPFIGIIDWLIVAVTSFFIVISIIKKRLTLDHFGKKILICILASIFLHNLFLSLSVHIWGLYWYGAYFSVFLSFLIAWLFDRLKRSKAFSCFILIPILFSLFYNFYYTNNQYKKYHYDLYHPDDLRMIFTNDVNRFHLDSTDQINTSATKKVWSNIDSYLQNQSPNDFPADLPKELGYLLIESGKFHPDSCWNAFDRWAGYYYRQGAHK